MSTLSSRWLTMLFLCRNRYSIGSSIGEDVAGPVGVAVVDHRGQRRRLAGAGRAGDQHEPALLHDEIEQHRRQPQLVERRDVAAHVADHQRDGAALAEDVDPEVADRPDRGTTGSSRARARTCAPAPRSSARRRPGGPSRCPSARSESGETTPLTLMLIGAPQEMNRSDACLSAISLNSRSRYMSRAPGATIRRRRRV